MIEITMENGKTIRIELDAEAAPITVENFTKLVKQGFYDGLTFHRIIPGFMIQGGCPEGTGMGGPGYGIKGEFAANGVENPIRHTRGVISMAGHVVEGMDVVDEIASVATDFRDKPKTPVVMKCVKVVDWDAPVKKTVLVFLGQEPADLSYHRRAEHTRQHGRQPAFVRRAGLLGRDRADVHRMQRVQLYLQPEIQF